MTAEEAKSITEQAAKNYPREQKDSLYSAVYLDVITDIKATAAKGKNGVHLNPIISKHTDDERVQSLLRTDLVKELTDLGYSTNADHVSWV